MREFLASLKEKTSAFGNHYRKYLRILNNNLPQFIDELEAKQKRDTVYILHPAYDFRNELKTVSELTNDTDMKLQFIGTYFALQFLLYNHQIIDHLKNDVISSPANRISVYKEFMKNAGNTLRMLTTHYICELMNALLDYKKCPKFVILGVGTKADQDDIDVGIVDEGDQDRLQFNRVISRISQEMIKYAVTFHFHLSEHIGDQYYSASIEEYKDVLARAISDYVIINEMLSAAIIAGDRHLFARYRKEIIDRYFHHPTGDNRYHEGYLRGILGEVGSLIEKPISTNRIHFKEDGMRVIKNIICAKKTIHRIQEVNAWDIIEKLKAIDSKRYDEYTALERSLTFFEIFRYLYQLFVTQDEEFLLDDIALQNIRRIARVMGYADIGMCWAEEHALVHYYEHVENVRRIIPTLMVDIQSHLKSISLFAPLFAYDHQGNLAEDFIESFKFFRGTSFWSDILDMLSAEPVLERFIKDMNSLPDHRRAEIVNDYIEWFKYDVYSLIHFLILLGQHKYSKSVFKELNKNLIENIDRIPDATRNIAYVYNNFPALINNYLALNDQSSLAFFNELSQNKTYESVIASLMCSFNYLVRVYLTSSVFFKRFLLQALSKYPEIIKSLEDQSRLSEFADGLYSSVDSMPTSSEKKLKLGEYCDFEMMRVGLKTLRGDPVDITNVEFTRFSDKYLHTLFDICRFEIESQSPRRIITDDLLAIFAAGGHAREQAYDDDYDLIVLLNSDDPTIISYCNKIISKMNEEMIKRGSIPHHRFGDYFGRFVILLKDIEHLLSEQRPDNFIEKSQVLGARLVVGSHRFEKGFLKRVIIPFIFEKKDEYVTQMQGELSSRHQSIESLPEFESNIKEGIGGLRDIEMIMLILKARYEIIEPVNMQLFKTVAHLESKLNIEMARLLDAFRFLVQLRDTYRIMVGASDTLVIETLDSVASLLGFSNAQALYSHYKAVTQEVKDCITQIISTL
jgi:hypothetical protein